MNKLLAPGPLMSGHESLEHLDCLTCHDPGGGIPITGCIKCHKGIGVQIKNRISFHGRMGGKTCITCHRDHRGRDFDSTRFDERSFDHRRTGFPLDGAHDGLKCEKCHKETRSSKLVRKEGIRFFGTSPSCRGCHEDDDIHFFTGEYAKVECSRCHTTTEWKNTKKFDHFKETGYALIGKHARQSCNKCHAPRGRGSEKYQFPELKTRKCLTCHTDHHGSKLSPKFRVGNCDSCHGQEQWRIAQFKHQVTTFPLRGQHARNKCIDCHKQNGSNARRGVAYYQWAGLNQTCGSCHADHHGYRNHRAAKVGILANCASCHNELGWKSRIRFNHDTQTRFPIIGKHKKNDCFDCHTTIRNDEARGQRNEPRRYFFKELTSKTCETCHKSPHSKAFHRRFKGVKCANCHTPLGWQKMATGGFLEGDRKFHDNTRFPLTGKHKNQSCQTCHLVDGKRKYKFPKADKGFCVNCHTSVHKKQFSRKFNLKSCGECHTTTNFFNRKPFDHNTTDYRITGAHLKFASNCVKCHVPTSRKLPTKPPKVAHKFKFKFADAGYCENCHKNVHRGQFSSEFIRMTSCRECHSTVNFVTRKPFDHNLTKFKLTGRHASIKKDCFKCHVKTNRKLDTNPPKVAHKFNFPGESNGYCTNCHDNEHRNQFSRKFYSKPCGECHLTTRWTKRKDFNHNQTSFRLRYKHRDVACRECHEPTRKRFRQGPRNRKGLYSFPELEKKNCQTCHQDPHKGSNGQRCTKCHTEAGWEKADNFHRDFTLVGVHLLLGCDQCHIDDRVLRGASEDCMVCHAKDDPHNGFLTPCQDCHTQNFWHSTTFSHDLTQFPLLGAHRLTDCSSCHNQGNYQALPTDCIGCHFLDAQSVVSPPHAGPRYETCQLCHNPFSFK